MRPNLPCPRAACKGSRPAARRGSRSRVVPRLQFVAPLLAELADRIQPGFGDAIEEAVGIQRLLAVRIGDGRRIDGRLERDLVVASPRRIEREVLLECAEHARLSGGYVDQQQPVGGVTVLPGEDAFAVATA